jgi:hypothetical protein
MGPAEIKRACEYWDAGHAACAKGEPRRPPSELKGSAASWWLIGWDNAMLDRREQERREGSEIRS